MSVGGQLIEIMPVHHPVLKRVVLRLWVIDHPKGRDWGDEICTYAEPQENLPKIGDRVWWWHSGTIYFDNDRQTMEQIGYSFCAPCSGV